MCSSLEHDVRFPIILHTMLEDAIKYKFDSVVSWVVVGGPNDYYSSSFKIHNPKLFTDSIMKRYFPKQTKYKSFQRQLNLYDFQRIRGSRREQANFSTYGSYSHPLFIRGNLFLCGKIERFYKKANSSSSSSSSTGNGIPIYQQNDGEGGFGTTTTSSNNNSNNGLLLQEHHFEQVYNHQGRQEEEVDLWPQLSLQEEGSVGCGASLSMMMQVLKNDNNEMMYSPLSDDSKHEGTTSSESLFSKDMIDDIITIFRRY